MLLGLCGGWLILFTGGFHHQLHRYTAETRFVSGLPALLMAAILFGLAALGALALAREHGARLFGQALACCAVLLPPALFIGIGIAGFGAFGA